MRSILMKDKKGLIFRNAFYAIVVVSMAIIAVGTWISDWNTTYDSGLTYDLGEYDKLDEMSNQASSQRGNVSVKSSFATEDFEGTSIRGVFGVINNLFKPFNVVFGEGGMLDSIEERWGLPNYIIRGTIAIMLFAITFALIALLFRKPGSKT